LLQAELVVFFLLFNFLGLSGMRSRSPKRALAMVSSSRRAVDETKHRAFLAFFAFFAFFFFSFFGFSSAAASALAGLSSAFGLSSAAAFSSFFACLQTYHMNENHRQQKKM
jgi:hypothetical protein